MMGLLETIVANHVGQQLVRILKIVMILYLVIEDVLTNINIAIIRAVLVGVWLVILIQEL